MSKVTKALPLPEIYYHGKSKDYYIRNDRGLWITLTEGSVKRHLKSQGFSSLPPEKGELSPLDECLLDLQLKQDVHYAAPLAGYDSGLYDINTRRILVTDAPHFIQPVKGEWPLLQTIFEGMFKDPISDQQPYWFGWLKVALASFKAKQWQPGQVLALAGPVQSAKSLAQALITKMFGGRSAKPYQFMTGLTAFNADLFAAEHLMIEDVAESTNLQKRRSFGAHIKEFAVNKEQHCHGKNQQAITLTPRWRVTISLNDDPERLMVLPPLDEDVQDKLILLKVQRKPMPLPTETAEQQQAFWDALLGELPAFLHFLENWEIPAELRSARYGITHYHHPDLVEALASLAPEQQLIEMIDAEIFNPALQRHHPWEGTAAELRSYLTGENRDCRKAAEALLHSPVACGTYLTRVTKRFAARITSHRINGTVHYSINPPAVPPAHISRS